MSRKGSIPFSRLNFQRLAALECRKPTSALVHKVLVLAQSARFVAAAAIAMSHTCVLESRIKISIIVGVHISISIGCRARIVELESALFLEPCTN